METGQVSTDGVVRPAVGTRGGGWLFPALLLVVVCIAAGVAQYARLGGAGNPLAGAGGRPSPEPTGKTVALEIDFGNGASKRFGALPWREAMSVADVLEAARDFRPGIRFTQVGEGANAFLTSLDGVAGEGAGGRNWIYAVDGRKGEVSFCLQQVGPGSRVLWTFAPQE